MARSKKYRVDLIPHIAHEEHLMTKGQRDNAIKRLEHLRQTKHPSITKPKLKEILNIEDDKVIEYLLETSIIYEPMQPRLPYPKTDTEFGRSLISNIPDKRAVALFATENHELIMDDDTLFIADGSHGYYLYLATVLREHRVNIVTNSLGVAGEYVLHSGKVASLEFPSYGRVYAEYGGVFDLDEELLIHKIADANIFISVRALDPGEGPCCGAPKDQIRRLAIESGSKVTLLCDYIDLCQRPGQYAPVFYGDHIKTWRKWLEKPYSYIVTTPHPEMPSEQLKYDPERRSPRTVPEPKEGVETDHPWELYLQNARHLRNAMGERFIEVDKMGNKLKYETSS